MDEKLIDILQIFALGVLLLRAGVLIAGITFCWFGYRLFSQVSSVSGADLEFGAHLKAKLYQVGPGVFFSLFGAVILTYSIINPPTLDLRGMQAAIGGTKLADATGSPATEPRVIIAGATDATSAAVDKATLLRAGQQVAFIGRIGANGALAAQDVPDIERMSRQIRLSIMLSVWQAEWGDAAEFTSWVRDATGEPDQDARQFFERM